MNREQFDEKVLQEFEQYRIKELKNKRDLIFQHAYEIAKMWAIRDYLTNSEDEEIEKLYPVAETVLENLYEYEWNYDSPMWGSFDSISQMVSEYIEERGL
jgi:hypothetical protein